jgi:hypothetical protein
MSKFLNNSFPSRILKKKHNAIAYHCVQDTIATKIIRFTFIQSEENGRFILIKLLSNEDFHYLVKKWIFCVLSFEN